MKVWVDGTASGHSKEMAHGPVTDTQEHLYAPPENRGLFYVYDNDDVNGEAI